jgi:hypothetical protein
LLAQGFRRPPALRFPLSRTGIVYRARIA